MVNKRPLRRECGGSGDEWQGGDEEEGLPTLVFQAHCVCLHHPVGSGHTALVHPVEVHLLLEEDGHLTELFHQARILLELVPVVHQLLNLSPFVSVIFGF